MNLPLKKKKLEKFRKRSSLWASISCNFFRRPNSSRQPHHKDRRCLLCPPEEESPASDHPHVVTRTSSSRSYPPRVGEATVGKKLPPPSLSPTDQASQPPPSPVRGLNNDFQRTSSIFSKVSCFSPCFLQDPEEFCGL